MCVGKVSHSNIFLLLKYICQLKLTWKKQNSKFSFTHLKLNHKQTLKLSGRSSWGSVACTVRRWFEGQEQSISKSAVGQLCYIRCRMPGIALPRGLWETGVQKMLYKDKALFIHCVDPAWFCLNSFPKLGQEGECMNKAVLGIHSEVFQRKLFCSLARSSDISLVFIPWTILRRL